MVQSTTILKAKTGLLILVLLVFLPGAFIVGLGVEQPAVLLAADVLLVTLAWGAMRIRGTRWKELGFRRVEKIRQLAWVPVIVTAILVGISLVIRPLVVYLTGETPNLEAFEQIRGNPGVLAGGLLVVWTIAAFGEERVFRGFLLNTIRELLPERAGEKMRWILALVISSVVFGFAHTYQGIAGIVITGIMGLGFGTVYLLKKRNLWFAIITHGLFDTAGFVLVYLGLHPNIQLVGNPF